MDDDCRKYGKAAADAWNDRYAYHKSKVGGFFGGGIDHESIKMGSSWADPTSYAIHHNHINDDVADYDCFDLNDPEENVFWDTKKKPDERGRYYSDKPAMTKLKNIKGSDVAKQMADVEPYN